MAELTPKNWPPRGPDTPNQISGFQQPAAQGFKPGRKAAEGRPGALCRPRRAPEPTAIV